MKINKLHLTQSSALLLPRFPTKAWSALAFRTSDHVPQKASADPDLSPSLQLAGLLHKGCETRFPGSPSRMAKGARLEVQVRSQTPQQDSAPEPSTASIGRLGA